MLPAGTRITPLAVAVLASFGRTEVRVIPRPRIGVMTTGAELAAPGEALASGQIRNSNGPMLTAMAAELGLACAAPLHAGDAAEEIGEKLDALADCQIVVVSGGVSAGNYDFVPQALADHGAEVVFHKVSQRPGKPLLFAHAAATLLWPARQSAFVSSVLPPLRGGGRAEDGRQRRRPGITRAGWLRR